MRAILGLLLLSALLSTHASDRTFTIVTNSAVVNHWPADDALIGTADDVVSAGLSTYAKSSPNSYGSYSFIATSLGFSNQPDPLLFGIYDTITFVVGAATLDTAAFITNDVPLIKDLHFSGTELFPGHGAYTVKLTNRDGGTYTHKGNVYSFSSQYDFVGTFVAGTATSTNASANGLVALIDASQYNSADLTAMDPNVADYIRTIAIPLAKNLGASGLLCGKMNLLTSGSIPGGGTGYFPPLQGYGVVLAMDLSSTSTSQLQISVRLTPRGPQLQWNAVAGQTYSVDAASSLSATFVPLVSGLTQGSYTDSSALGQVTRFYRLSSP